MFARLSRKIFPTGLGRQYARDLCAYLAESGETALQLRNPKGTLTALAPITI